MVVNVSEESIPALSESIGGEDNGGLISSEPNKIVTPDSSIKGCDSWSSSSCFSRK